MSVLIKKQISILFSSSEINNAQTISADGARFEVSLSGPISVPQSAVSCELAVTRASIWNTSPNIASFFNNNTFSFTTTNAGNPGPHVIVIPDGLYSVGGLNSFFNTSFVNIGLPGNLIVLTGDSSTQKTVLTYLTAGDFVTFPNVGSVREVLGFDARTSPVTPQGAGFSDFSDNPAAFNLNNSYTIRSDIISQGVPINNVGAGVIAQIPITAAPGSQINYDPQNVTWVDATELIGMPKLNINFQLGNQDLQSTPTSGDDWSFILTVRYTLLMSDMKVPMKPV